MMIFAFLRRWFHQSSVTPVTELQPEPAPDEAEARFQAGVRLACAAGNAGDYAKAAHCYEQAAEQNHSLAQFNLAMMYEHGQGVTRDPEKAALWMRRSAESGDAGAQYKLGTQDHLIGRGNGGSLPTASETRIEALKWVQLSAAQGYRGASTACEYVALKMTWEEVAESTRRAAAFATSHTTTLSA